MPKGRKPEYNAVVKIGERWETIGAAWPLEDKDGYSVRLTLVPTNWDGSLALLPRKGDD